MSIFDIFTFKKEASYLFTSENFATVLEKAREEIISHANEAIPGPEKKVLVDNIVIFQIKEFRNTFKNKLILWIIDQIIKTIPTVTQLVYDFLKEKVKDL